MNETPVMTKQDALTLQPESTALSAPQNPIMPLLAMAMEKDLDLDRMKELMQLKREWDADEAKKAFNVAFSAFKAEAVSIIKNTTVAAGPLEGKKYANLFGVVNAVTPALSKHGLSHSWKLSKDDAAWMEVTCTIRHALGYSESVSMGAAPDAGPGRNAIQARGSAKSYLERYTLLAVTGMAASDEDNDGNGAEDNDHPRVSEAQLTEWLTYIRDANTPEDVKKAFANAQKSAKEVGDKAAMGFLVSAVVKRYVKWIQETETPAGAIAAFQDGYKVIHPTGNITAEKELVAAKDKRKGELK